MLDQAADIPERHLAETGIHIATEQRLSIFPKRLMHVHAGAIFLEERLGHERGVQAVLCRNILDDVFVGHHPVCHL